MNVPDFEDLSDEETTSVVRGFVVGDLHFKTKNVLRAKEFVGACLCAVEEYKPDFIVLLGDILDTHEIVRTQPYILATTFIEQLSKIAEVFVLIGNHDYINHSQFLSENHPFNPLKKWDNVTVVDKVVTRLIKDNTFTFVPYVPPGRFIEALDTTNNWKSSECIFAHQEFRGCRMGAFVSTCGDEWNDEFPRVISGHIHDDQIVGDNIWYTGSAIQHSFAETSNKSVWVVDWENGKQSIDKVDLGLKKKKMIYTDMKNIKDILTKDFRDTEVKLNIKGTMEELAVFRKSKDYQKLIKASVRIVFNPIKVDDEETTSKTRNSDYKSVLYDLVLKDDELKENFEKMFGEIPTTTAEDEIELLSETVENLDIENDPSEIDSEEVVMSENEELSEIDSEEVEEMSENEEELSEGGSEVEEMSENEDLGGSEEVEEMSENEEEMVCYKCNESVSCYCIACDNCVCEKCVEETHGVCPMCRKEYQRISDIEMYSSEEEVDSDEKDYGSEEEPPICNFCENEPGFVCGECSYLVCEECTEELETCQTCGGDFISFDDIEDDSDYTESDKEN